MIPRPLQQWRVAWLAFGGTRIRYFESEDEARVWFDYCSAGWIDATVHLSSRVVGPWEYQQALDPGKVDIDTARVL